jgi:hypothetical protein
MDSEEAPVTLHRSVAASPGLIVAGAALKLRMAGAVPVEFPPELELPLELDTPVPEPEPLDVPVPAVAPTDPEEPVGPLPVPVEAEVEPVVDAELDAPATELPASGTWKQ